MTNLEMDARDVMEQIQMAEVRHMQMGALVSYQLQYPDMTIRDFFGMAKSAGLEDQRGGFLMTVAELREKLSHFDDDEQVLFYYLKDNILTNALLEDINSYGMGIEFTIKTHTNLWRKTHVTTNRYVRCSFEKCRVSR